jgi:aspartate/methionine/tyrosine aminotransferase
MKIEEFKLERNQSLFENTVSYNLTESGIHPCALKDFLSEEEQQEVLGLELGYGQTNGDPGLRDAIAAMYPGYDRDNVLATNGSAEANFVAIWSLLDKGDEIAVMLPNYMLVWGLARSFGIKVKPFHLHHEREWGIDWAELEGAVSGNTKMIVICNPNNPTGAVMSNVDMDRVAGIADRVGAYIASDEIYRGSELDGREGISFHDVYDRSIILSGLSKSMAHPGLRLGWIAAEKAIVEECWHHHDYTSISTGIISQYVGQKLLEPDRRHRILNRGRDILRTNLDYLTRWIAKRSDRFSLTPPRAGGMAFVHYKMPINSSELADRLRREKSVFVVPGDWYGMDQYLRFGIGCEHRVLKEGLDLIDEFLEENG